MKCSRRKRRQLPKRQSGNSQWAQDKEPDDKSDCDEQIKLPRENYKYELGTMLYFYLMKYKYIHKGYKRKQANHDVNSC